MEEKYFKFPAGFFWGTSASAHQAEGGNHNDWSEWEKKNAERLAEEVESKFGHLKNWPEIKEQAQNPQNYISGRACDYYNRYEEDFNIAASLGHNTHRFSIEWSRVEPEEGKFDEKEIEHYRQVIRALKKYGLEPFLTVWHWTLPLWLKDKGGWENKKTPDYFVRYSEKLIRLFGNDVKFWITLNEPLVYASQSYLTGIWPPQKKSFFQYFKVLKHLAEAHFRSYQIIKKINPRAQIGIAKNNVYFESAGGPINYILKRLIDWWWNFRFLNQIKNYQDFIGLNYYFHNRINYGFKKNKNRILSDLQWEIYPEGIYHTLKDLKKYGRPLYITENGIADALDQKRADFIKNHLRFMHQAIEKGVDVRGYFYWSLTDNFEWDKGFWTRFGLVEINYKTKKRKVRPSALIYADICRNNLLKI